MALRLMPRAAGRPATALHFCGGPANVSCPRPTRAPREGGSAPRRGELTARRHRRFGVATEESVASSSLSHLAAQASLGRLGPSPSAGDRGASTACSGRRRLRSLAAEDGRTLRRSRWCPDGRIRPVLKHGPRSATRVRVRGWQTRRRNESEGEASGPLWREPPPSEGGASSTDPGLRCGGI